MNRGMKMIFGLLGLFVFSLVSSRGIVSDSYSVDKYKIALSGSDSNDYVGREIVFDIVDVKSGENSVSVVFGGSGGGSGRAGWTGGGDNGSGGGSGVFFGEFGVKIYNLLNRVDSGKFVDFNYSINASGNLSGTVVTNFILSSFFGKNVSTGKMVVYLDKGERVVLNSRIYIPEEIRSGEYYLIGNSYYAEENLSAKDILGIKVKGSLPIVNPDYFKWGIIIGVVLALALLGVRYRKWVMIWKYFIKYYISLVNYVRRKFR